MRILLAIVLNALALGAATFLLPGLNLTGWSQEPMMTVLAFLLAGAIFGVINVSIKPILSILAAPITCLTLGLFAIVINALMLMLTGWITSWFPDVHFEIENFWWAILGAVVISLVSALLNRFIVVPIEEETRRRQR